MGLLDWFRSTPAARPVEWIESPRGAAQGAPRAPLVLFGNMAGRDLAQVISTQSTLRTVLVPAFEQLEPLLREHEVVGVVAHSRTTHPGEAGQVIALTHQLRPDAATLYQAWDYHVGRGATRAIEYRADGLLMPAIDMNDMFRVLFATLQRKHTGAAPPATVEEHTAILQEHAGSSPFWELQDRIVSDYW